MKAQISGQIFMYIFAMVVVMLILIFGYKAVTSIMSAGKCMEVTQFKNKITSDLVQAKGYGTEKKNKAYNLPSGYTEVCFADLESPSTEIANKLVANEVQALTKNAFLMPKKGSCQDEWFLLKNMGVINLNPGEDAGFKCFETARGKLTLNLIGCGDKTMITESQSASASDC